MKIRTTLTWTWLVLAGVVGIGLFVLKYEVQSLETRLSELNTSIRADQQAVHVLKAEWNFLNDPARLRKLSQRHMDLTPIRPGQVTTYSALPFRSSTFANAAADTRAPELASIDAPNAQQ